ncbi:MAG: hypothetical protein IJ368_02525 [Oscillospiraceae bacterium]|nr:hypothetical protein [Oscillospiraceae bacterium]
MKKRAVEAAVIVIILLAVFAAVNFVTARTADTMRKIDGKYYNIGERELSLILMTDEGLEQLADFDRLETLKLSSYTAEIIYSYPMEQRDEIKRMTLETYSYCTDLSDISAAAAVKNLKELDISKCAVSDISCLADLKLTALDISYTNVKDIEVLAEMDCIQSLSMISVEADDYSPLLEMDNLQTLTISKECSNEVIKRLKSKITVTEYEEKN